MASTPAFMSADGRSGGVLPRLSDLRTLRRFARMMNVRLSLYAVPLALRAAATALDGAAMLLLIPLGKGVAGNDFEFLWQWPGFARLHEVFVTGDPLAHAPNRLAFVALVATILLASIATIGVGYVATVLCAYRNGAYVSRVNTFTLERCLSFGKLYFDRTPQAHVHEALGDSHVVLRILDLLENAVSSLLQLVMQVVVIVAISWPLTLLTLVMLPAMRYTDRWIVGRTGAAAGRLAQEELVLGTRVFNILSCIPLIKACRFEEQTLRRYRDAMERFRRLTFARQAISGVAGPLQQTMVLCTLLVVVLVAVAFMRSDGMAELGALCAFLVVARRAMPTLWLVTDLRVGLADAWPQLSRLVALFDDDDKCFVRGGTREFAGLRVGLEVRDVDFSYHDGVRVLSGLSFDVPAGQTVAIVGETGCGKTTVLSLLARLYECPPDSILVDGVDLRSFSLASLSRKIALVSQEPWLFNDTLRNNLLFGLDREVAAAEFTEVLTRARLDSVVARLPHGLDSAIGDRGVKLSGGEKQRVSIARALLRRADILLLDEATASLDTETERRVQRALEESSRGRTVIIVAHRISTVRHADRIVVMGGGRVIEEGSWSELMAMDGAFARLWHAQTQPAASHPPVTLEPAPRL
jgi:ATP-binding cassette, subfamily B, bacterial MsbA